MHKQDCMSISKLNISHLLRNGVALFSHFDKPIGGLFSVLSLPHFYSVVYELRLTFNAVLNKDANIEVQEQIDMPEL